MIRPGLVSVTFRHLAPDRIVTLCSQLGLGAIEWAGDVHVPPGDLARAREVRALCQAAGIEVVSYGSYYQFESTGDWKRVLETALALGSPLVRVWAGSRGSEQTEPAERERLAQRINRACDQADATGIKVVVEYHGGTLTDSMASTAELLEKCPRLLTHWQPPNQSTVEARQASLEAVLPRLAHLHVFHWTGPANDRRPLTEGEADWKTYLSAATRAPGDRWALHEFVANDDPAQLAADVVVLKGLLADLAVSSAPGKASQGGC